jgi:hypothetical protein
MIGNHGEALLREGVSSFKKDIALYDLSDGSEISAAFHIRIVQDVQRSLLMRVDIVRTRSRAGVEEGPSIDQRSNQFVQASDQEVGLPHSL